MTDLAAMFDNDEAWPDELWDLTRESHEALVRLDGKLDPELQGELEDVVILHERRMTAWREWGERLGHVLPLMR